MDTAFFLYFKKAIIYVYPLLHLPYMHIRIGCVYLSKFLRHTDFSLPPTLTTLIALHILEFLSCFLVHKCELFI